MRLRTLIGTLTILLAGCIQASQVNRTRRRPHRYPPRCDAITLDLQDSWGPPGVSLTWHATTTNGSVLRLDSVEDRGPAHFVARRAGAPSRPGFPCSLPGGRRRHREDRGTRHRDTRGHGGLSSRPRPHDYRCGDLASDHQFRDRAGARLVEGDGWVNCGQGWQQLGWIKPRICFAIDRLATPVPAQGAPRNDGGPLPKPQI